MKILGVDTTGESMSAALTDNGNVICELFLNNGKKHSQTLMVAVEDILKYAQLRVQDIDAYAVAAGPGSFTGIRIGVAAVAAMAYAADKPVYAVNTLDALMESVQDSVTACAIMDARRGEVYTAARRGRDTIIKECAIPLEQLLEELMSYKDVVFVGDAALKYGERILAERPDSCFLPLQFLLQRASSVCMCAVNGKAEQVTHNSLRPHYLRESQAERVKKNEAG